MQNSSSSNVTVKSEIPQVRCRSPVVADAVQMWSLVSAAESLDLNSIYCYLLLCRDFSSTSLVACVGDELVGMVTGYRPPAQTQTLFVWQVAVSPAWRGKRVASRLLKQLADTSAQQGCRFIEATVTPTNVASQQLFRSLASELGVACSTTDGFSAASFGSGEHEAEVLYRLGPIRSNQQGD